MDSSQDEHDALPTLFIPHGGGPCFFMDWTMGPADTWHKMGHWLKNLGKSLDAASVRTKPINDPKAIVVFSAHWESDIVTINSAARPELIFDYYNFPPHTYDLEYPAPGDPELANTIERMLSNAGISCRQDPNHGFDHGVFIPFMLIYPAANIPIVQVSLVCSLDPQEHMKIGQALAALRKENVLLVGSGMSYHNMAALMNVDQPHADSDLFDHWLTGICEAAPNQRNEALCGWYSAPGARQAHPREEHLLPLMVVAGAATSDLGKKIYSDRVLGAAVSGFRFG